MLEAKREKLIKFVKRWPIIYHFLRRLYYAVSLRHLLELLFGTEVREKEWATRHLRKSDKDDWGKGNTDWIKGYWDSQNHPHRQFLVEKIGVFSPISSILEIGCNCGPNLCLLAKKFPNAEIRGVDINPMAVKKGNEYLMQERISNVRLSVGKADELSEFPNKAFEIVFTDAVLIYIGPDKIEKVIKEMLRIASRCLILCEWHDFSMKDKQGRGLYHLGFWKRDYNALLEKFVQKDQITVIKIPECLWPETGWGEAGAMVTVTIR